MTTCNESGNNYLDKVLQSALHHSRPEKRVEMIYILGELRDPRALDALKAIMAEDNPYLVSEAVEAIGKIGGDDAFEQLRIMMTHPSFMVRGEVAMALRRMDNPERDKLLNQLLTDNDSSPYVRKCANHVLNNDNVNLKWMET